MALMMMIRVCALLVAVLLSGATSQGCVHGSYRLTGGPNEFEGRLEFCSNSTWGHVCASEWQLADSAVACRHLFGENSTRNLRLITENHHYGAEIGQAFVNNITCVGNETSLSECQQDYINETGCDGLASVHGGFAYLTCQSPSCSEFSVRLSGGATESSGRVEWCDEQGFLRQVCDTDWDDQDAAVVCSQLGYNGAESLTGFSLSDVRLSGLDRVNCSGGEAGLSDCPAVSRILLNRENCLFAGANCSVIPSPAPSSTAQPTSTLSIPGATSTAQGGTVGISVGSTASPTLGPPPPVPADSNFLVIVIGAVGGAVVFLLLLIVLLFIAILVRKKKRKKYDVSPENKQVGFSNLTLPSDTLERPAGSSTMASTHSSRGRVDSDVDHVLLNPLYTRNDNKPNSNTSDQSSEPEDPGYAEIGLGVKPKATSPTSLGKSLHSPNLPLIVQDSGGMLGGLSRTARPYRDEEGYAALGNDPQQHVYDEMPTHGYFDLSKMSTSMRQNQVPFDELVLSASPYEAPHVHLRDVSPELMRGSLVSPQHQLSKSQPNLLDIPAMKGFVVSPQLTASRTSIYSQDSQPEYKELEDLGANRYDSPRNVFPGNEARIPHGYEDVAVVKEMARAYESPVVTLNGRHQFDVSDEGMELQTIPEDVPL